MDNKFDKLPVNLGDQIKRIREALNLNQKEFAKKLGLSNSYLCEIEKGNRGPGFKFFIHFAERLNVSLDWLMLGKGSMFFNESTDSPSDNYKVLEQIPQARELIEMLAKSPYARFSILAFSTSFFLNNEETIKKDIARTNLDKPLPGKTIEKEEP